MVHVEPVSENVSATALSFSYTTRNDKTKMGGCGFLTSTAGCAGCWGAVLCVVMRCAVLVSAS